MVICVAEDRGSCEVSIKLLLLSLARHCPKFQVFLFFPAASAELILWLEDYPNVTLSQAPISGGTEFNIKPQLMLSLMDKGEKDILWIDSDIIVLDDFSRILSLSDDSTFVTTEEALGGRYKAHDNKRTRQWGLQVGRTLPFAVNSGIVRATTVHRPLLEHWRDLLESSTYRAAMRLNWRDRPWHMLTDQDALTALLGASEFSNLKTKYLRRGENIIQYFGPLGYTVSERMRGLLGRGPQFVHSQGRKPWIDPWNKVPLFHMGEYLRAVYLDLSPYTLAATQYLSELKEDSSWMMPHFKLSGILRLLGLGYPPLVGFPLAVVWDLLRSPAMTGLATNLLHLGQSAATQIGNLHAKFR